MAVVFFSAAVMIIDQSGASGCPAAADLAFCCFYFFGFPWLFCRERPKHGFA
jgi:hypothetical protein